jgi:hypothetical protein
MRKGTYFPALAVCCGLVLLAISGGPSAGQGEVKITDESAPIVVQPSSEGATIKVKPAEPAAPAKPAPAAATTAPTPETTALVAEVTRMETQADTMLANQVKINAALDELASTINQARIYASRAGKGSAP